MKFGSTQRGTFFPEGVAFGTLRTITAPCTVDRIIALPPAAQKVQIRVMLSESLKGVIAQMLLRTVGEKRVTAHEILLVPLVVANLIHESKTFQLPSQLQKRNAKPCIEFARS